MVNANGKTYITKIVRYSLDFITFDKNNHRKKTFKTAHLQQF